MADVQPDNVGKFNLSAAADGYNAENAPAAVSSYRFNENGRLKPARWRQRQMTVMSYTAPV
ncbi:TPA: YadA-like family protein [Morganella morganii]|nr:YadA-like family protein [Morganella morganii]